jgi:trk system potassium uptake protein TrkA
VGGGQIGYQLGKALIADGHEILVIEKNVAVSQSLSDELGSDIVLHGDGCEVVILAEAGTSRADILVAVTGEDEDNLVACQIAKNKFAVPRTIARVTNPRYEALFRKLGIDVTVSSTSILLEYIEHEIPSHPLLHLMDIHDRGLEIIEVTIPAESRWAGKKIRDINLPAGTVLSLIIRKLRNPIIPDAETVLEAEDQVIAVTPVGAEDELRILLAE